MIRFADGSRRGRRRKAGALSREDVWADLCVRAGPDGQVRATVRQLADAWGWSFNSAAAFVRPYRDDQGAIRLVRNSDGNFAQVPSRPVMRYHGGKRRIRAWVIAHFPAHRTYTEVFGGAASVLFGKSRSYAEVYNDLDGEVVNVFRVLRDPEQAAELERLVRLTPFAREEFEESYLPAEDLVERARRTLFRSFAGFGSAAVMREHKTGFRCNTTRSGSTPAQDWARYPEEISVFGERLQGVVIENRPALEVVQRFDGPETLHYLDPPYPHGTRSFKQRESGQVYRHEMTDDDHRALAEAARAARGMVVISGYPCDLYDLELYPDWERVSRDTHADGAEKRTEVLWINPAAWARLHDRPLDLLETRTGTDR